ncbi:MAG: SgcJ/EcaC family oxidoreductase [Isosphaeraceae bacterium]
MKNVILMFIAVTVGTELGLSAQETKKEPPARPESRETTSAAIAPTGRDDDEAAIKKLLESFIKAFNAGDAEATAATYSETAIVVDEQGERTEGRDAIRDQYADAFADSPGSTISIQVDARRFLGPETAIEVGRTTITPKEDGEIPETTRFTTVYVKHGGHWLQSAVRDEESHTLTAHDHLKELEWLVGDWINESQDAVVDTTCKWSDDGQFLVREFTMKTQGEKVLSGSQRIGWDPTRHQFKMWIFDSEGGFGEGYWTRDGDRWVIKSEGIRQDGLHASATNIITRLGKDRASWQSLNRTLGSVALPEIDEFTIVRKPPEVGK